jgi:hypothetical protein
MQAEVLMQGDTVFVRGRRDLFRDNPVTVPLTPSPG